MISVLMLTGWRAVGYGMMIYLSAMIGISKDYYEAASLDGATSVQKFWKITLPLLSPTTLFLFVTDIHLLYEGISVRGYPDPGRPLPLHGGVCL